MSLMTLNELKLIIAFIVVCPLVVNAKTLFLKLLCMLNLD